MTVDELLEQIDDMIDKAWSFPLSGGKCLVEADRLRDLIDDIRGNMPSEIRQAKALVADRADIIATIGFRCFVVTVNFIFCEMFSCYRTFSVLRRIQ